MKQQQARLYRNLVAFSSGFILAIGFSISGLTNPAKVLATFNISQWQPHLLWVLLIALAVHIPAYNFVKKRKKPFLDQHIFTPDDTSIDMQMLIGAVLIGCGWAMSGYDPATGLAATAGGSWEALAFVIAMTVGMVSHHFYKTFTR